MEENKLKHFVCENNVRISCNAYPDVHLRWQVHGLTLQTQAT